LETHGERALVRLDEEGPVIRCRNQGAAVGQEVVVAARASALRYSDAASGADQGLAGQVLSAVYLGEYSELHVQVGPWRLTCIAPENEAGGENGRRYRAGDPIYVGIDADKALALPR